MKSPFPGMDPFIEARGLWEDFHHNLIGEIHSFLAEQVPSQYVVRTGERNYLVLVDAERGKEKHVFKPNVGVIAPTANMPEATQATAVLEEHDEEALTMRGVVAEEFRESFVEILALEPERRLVTCIEILSPTNKRKGSPGWDQYLRKRQSMLLGEANLVEIDLLRGGERFPMIDPWPGSPYYLLVARKSRMPFCRVWKAHFRKRLPEIPVPLESPDPDVSLDLQPMIETIYARSRYYRDIDYAKVITPPLADEDQAWLRQQITS